MAVMVEMMLIEWWGAGESVMVMILVMVAVSVVVV